MKNKELYLSKIKKLEKVHMHVPHPVMTLLVIWILNK